MRKWTCLPGTPGVETTDPAHGAAQALTFVRVSLVFMLILVSLVFLLVLILLSTSPSSVGAATIRVGPDGDMDHTTITDAVDAAVEGDTIEVHPGTYGENILLDRSWLNLTAVGPVVIKGSSGRGALVVTGYGISVRGFRLEPELVDTGGPGGPGI